MNAAQKINHVYRYGSPESQDEAKEILTALSRAGWLDDDWWAEAENHPEGLRAVTIVASILEKIKLKSFHSGYLAGDLSQTGGQ